MLTSISERLNAGSKEFMIQSQCLLKMVMGDGLVIAHYIGSTAYALADIKLLTRHFISISTSFLAKQEK